MAVVNAFVTGNAEAVAVDTGVAARFSGGVVKAIPFSFEVAAADDDGSVYRIGRMSPRAIILSIQLLSDAIANATDYEIGFYKALTLDGSAVDIDCLLGSTDINAGNAALAEVFVPTISNYGKEAYLLAGVAAADAEKYGSFDLAITANTVGTAAGTISGLVLFIDGV